MEISQNQKVYYIINPRNYTLKEAIQNLATLTHYETSLEALEDLDNNSKLGRSLIKKVTETWSDPDWPTIEVRIHVTPASFSGWSQETQMTNKMLSNNEPLAEPLFIDHSV